MCVCACVCVCVCVCVCACVRFQYLRYNSKVAPPPLPSIVVQRITSSTPNVYNILITRCSILYVKAGVTVHTGCYIPTCSHKEKWFSHPHTGDPVVPTVVAVSHHSHITVGL